MMPSVRAPAKIENGSASTQPGACTTDPCSAVVDCGVLVSTFLITTVTASTIIVGRIDSQLA